MKNKAKQNETQLPIQFKFIEKVETCMMNWVYRNGIKLRKIHCVVPFLSEDKDLVVWLFYDTEKMKKLYQNDGTNNIVQNKYLNYLKVLDYPDEYLKQVSFYIDSEENVLKNYEGNYFYRLR